MNIEYTQYACMCLWLQSYSPAHLVLRDAPNYVCEIKLRLVMCVCVVCLLYIFMDPVFDTAIRCECLMFVYLNSCIG